MSLMYAMCNGVKYSIFYTTVTYKVHTFKQKNKNDENVINSKVYKLVSGQKLSPVFYNKSSS